jgi:Mg/Co/Ni transporter MgtE
MFDVYDASTQARIAEAIDLAAAAALTQLDPDEIAWAIEEEGSCDTDEHHVVAHDTDD